MVCNHGFWRERTLVIDVLATPETSHWGNSGDTDYPKLIKMVKSREMLPQYIDDVKGLCPNKNIKELTFGRPAREMLDAIGGSIPNENKFDHLMSLMTFNGCKEQQMAHIRNDLATPMPLEFMNQSVEDVPVDVLLQIVSKCGMKK